VFLIKNNSQHSVHDHLDGKNESKTVELHRFTRPGRHPHCLPGSACAGRPGSGAIVISQTVLQYDADHNGTRGSLCDSIGVVQPALEDRLSRETEHAVDYERISSQVDDLKKTLKCDQLPQGK
jgi:hypothetical protein